ncbi:MAG: 1,4-alpha-glucan branching protein [Bacteroidetes bacterium RIFOXYA12_FULL_35_11]|nr:MAG: 1,4-alpha-glucan branching protein [Bacteroidetes bacterium GWF2_35_48]OFY77996.1 MAG: 1,4-alpha-glucan branching protein [Bacteroidetes bacterium RIFOXYA12_FULL_35_11]OFY94004.1 MAG: 1,4-alpha-glucan branching protein [Bacteroidetes bacterium RIFOXYB2_FULL_35_7]
METLELIKNDTYLEPFAETIIRRHQLFSDKELELKGRFDFLHDAMNGYLYYGLHKYADKWVFREWAPHATYIYFLAAFNNWKPDSAFLLQRKENGNWEIELPLNLLKHYDEYKLLVCWEDGSGERIPAWARRVVQDERTLIFNAQVWNPKKEYKWKNKKIKLPQYPFVYEAHVGMSSEEGKVSSYEEFRVNVLPRIHTAGYNVIQLMAVQEHPYYGSFGYHVSNYFAASFRQGTPEELKHLIDDAHGLGIAVIMDIVHSHSVKNIVEGLSQFDGTSYLYFHEGGRGDHPAWDSRCFNYGKNEVLHFLLSNCKFWLDEYNFDGYRFDGVTSMLYNDHGLGSDFHSYEQYFNLNQDEDAIVYLMLANKLIHDYKPDAISIAEEMSGMPGLASPLDDGGYGFDYRLALGTPDYWIKLIKEVRDEDWHVGDMFYRLSDKRNEEKVISYAECHDQAIVGDQTIIFRLIGANMYYDMHRQHQNLYVDRGVALHKMIRLVTAGTAGNGYLNFMGNEFGHPEWIDFPREGNNWSFHYARRQWSLSDNPDLHYMGLGFFDRDMITLLKKEKIFTFYSEPLVRNNEDQVLVFKRGKLYFIFNFNPVTSFTDYGIEIPKGNYSILLNSDSAMYNGHNRINETMVYETINSNKKNYLRLYLPSHCCLVVKKGK